MGTYKTNITRRDFLKISALGVGSLASMPFKRIMPAEAFPNSERLGRAFNKIDIKLKPDFNAQTVGVKYDDEVVPWLREVVGFHPYRFRQRWVETPDGYIWASDLQPVKNTPNTPVAVLPDSSLGPGMWVEVSIPWVDVTLENAPISPGFKYRVEGGLPIRLYYSQILWVDQIKKDDTGQTLYRMKERYGYGDIMWAKGEALRPITKEEVAPINPETENKLVVVNVEEKYQTLSCYEGNNEVYFCRISAGKKYNPDGKFLGQSATPKGTMNIWRKQISTHMSGGTTGAGYDLPGIGWTTLFSGEGVAIHSTFWHNNYGGELMSHGCVNAAPDDAKFVFRWTNPPVPYDPGDLYSKDTDILPTKVQVLEETE
jgi:hypothetical protein